MSEQPLTVPAPNRTMPAMEVTPPAPGALAGLVAVLAAIVERTCVDTVPTAEVEQKDAA